MKPEFEKSDHCPFPPNLFPESGQHFKAAGHLKMVKPTTGRNLSWAIFPNDDGTVTLTVFERDKSASIELNEVSLGQMIEILKFHAIGTGSHLRQQ